MCGTEQVVHGVLFIMSFLCVWAKRSNKMKELLDLKSSKVLMNLQRFAEGNDGTDGEESADEPDGPITFDNQSDFDSATDKRIAKALETAKVAWQEDANQQIEQAKTEGEKLAKMTADKKAEYEREKRDKEITDREARINERELKATAYEQLASKGLPKELISTLNFSNAESCEASITAVETSFSAAVQRAVEGRLNKSVDKPLGGGAGVSGTNNPFKDGSINLTEQGRLLRDDPEQAKKLMDLAQL